MGLAKHGILVAVVTILMSFMILRMEWATVRYILLSNDHHDASIEFIVNHIGLFVIALLAKFTAVLMIWGIVKNYHRLLIPWLIVYGLTVVLCTISIWYDVVTTTFQFDNILFGVILLGIQIIIVYPVFLLYANIRFESQDIPEDLSNMYRPHKYHSYDDFLRKTSL
ncbi:uncharacterized protein LOC142237814 [Haematobia irritans]|uniref:uncharacterized protein LOC142237814 n=1 Tax=Haematobia irritans TaxID=7368 RepID=UPI003F4FF5F5